MSAIGTGQQYDDQERDRRGGGDHQHLDPAGGGGRRAGRTGRFGLVAVGSGVRALHGLLSVTMSRIAEATGIGRATLYKYFPDPEAILYAWHERQVTDHLAQLTQARDRAARPGERLAAVLEAYALLSRHQHGHHAPDLVALLHRGEHLTGVQQQVHDLVRDLLADAAQAGEVRGDIAPDELALYCLHALTAARSLPSQAAVRRLVTLTLAALRPSG
jgi:AcrR family transcriptional regulator